MTKWENFLDYIDASVSGIFKTKDLENAGFPRAYIQRLIKSGRLNRASRGVYVRDDVWDDEYYLLQRRYGRGIFSHETSLYFWGFSDRIPFPYTMTFPKGYNSSALANEDVIVKRAKSEIYSLGVTETLSPYGNLIRLYDLERSLCDVVRGSQGDIQIVVPAMQRYAASRKKNLCKLAEYANRLRVMPKIARYMEALL